MENAKPERNYRHSDLRGTSLLRHSGLRGTSNTGISSLYPLIVKDSGIRPALCSVQNRNDVMENARHERNYCHSDFRGTMQYRNLPNQNRLLLRVRNTEIYLS